MTIRHLLLICLLLALLPACGGGKPSAPPLDNSAVYESPAAGFRLIVPEGWIQQVKTTLPTGEIDKERTLVVYRSSHPTPASWEVSCIDLAADEVVPYLIKRKRSGTIWRPEGKPQTVTVDGREGQRYTFLARVRGQASVCELVVFQRQNRAYFFAGFYPAGNLVRRQHIRDILAAVRWTS